MLDNTEYTHATIIPLIGGITLGQEIAFNSKPEYFLSYSPFSNNDQHIVEYYKDIPYAVLDDGDSHTHKYVDVMSTTCPCAGLSSLSPSSSSDNSANDWLYTSAELVLDSIKPKVFWGENAPRLASKMGEPVVAKLRAIGKRHGYTFSIYKTRSISHGLSQVRDRTFYFFWKGRDIPVFEYVHREHQKIEDMIRAVPKLDDDPMSQILSNKNRPTDNPFYKYVLEVIEGGISHKDFAKKIEKTTNPLDYIEAQGLSYNEVAEWMDSNGFVRAAIKCRRMQDKLDSGGNIMRKNTEIPKDYFGAFVGHMPTSVTHPDEDRYLTIREAMEVMKLPRDFNLVGGLKNLNHICQNVPVTTASDMAYQIKKYLNGELETIETSFMIQDNKKQSYWYEQININLDEFCSYA